ncbi:protein-(glutamine-N5) methyltransferase, release factor-specific [Saccharopolyspora kobensis]|uniref:Protein-(Glutamine-N5) methyltransferase, release factor-specific n=1 Tax=Saccharopolyspora kobensis TaxID=146035 RepID=A0A1H5V0L6_9PSEU|nr:peptide chain release factor N(5)-glutamine methyltransferase [Saccharopolyspora kobensis]SEF80017.1 protein-(glutamine-N5) methyltransferase, release factor-specific [Saccharopolyspora kobensis]SFC67559.1 protein-(glutamine-N5) methyltransferase, release factor-specific [Saccharopolyspora kobensis]
MSSRTSQPGFDVIVVGNGALGSSLAVELAGRQGSVALIGPAHRPYAASAAAGAMLGCFGEVTTALLDNAHGMTKFDLDLKAKDIWPEWLQNISDGTSDGTELLTASGTTVLLNTVGSGPIDSGNYAAIRAMLDKYDEPYESVDPADISWLDPDPNSRPLEALHIPGEHAVDSGRLLRRLERTAEDRGVHVVDDQAVSLVNSDGQVRGVVLASGATLSARKVVLAGGVGSQDLIDSVPGLGACIPRLVAGYGVSVVMTTQDGTQPESVIRTPNRAFACGLHVVPRGLGRVYVGATNIINPRPLADPVLRDLEFLTGCAHRQIRRNLWSSSIVQVNVGNRPVSLDGFPLLGETPLDGLWMMTGTYRDGLFLSPLLAREFARRLSGEEPELDLDAFTPERAPLEGVSREAVIDTTVEHMLATGYEHHWNIPTDWQEYLAADLKPIYTRWADEIDAGFTPPPELLASSRLHPHMVEWLRSYYDNCRAKFGAPASAEVRTVRDQVDRAQEVLTSAQVWAPRQDVLALAAHVTHSTPETLDLDASLTGAGAEEFWSLVRRRADRVPLEYLTGRATLFDLEFHVNEGVFIPRVHSEAMIENALARCSVNRLRAVDLCTGSGAIALAIARLRADATVTGVDISAAAVECARRNAERLQEKVPNAAEFIEGDASDPDLLADLAGGVDLITANPPYVPHSLQIPPEWAVYQPTEAIYSGWDGLDLTRSIAATAARLLKKGGVLAIEHYDTVVDDVVDILRSAGFTSVTSHTDHDGFARYVVAQYLEA